MEFKGENVAVSSTDIVWAVYSFKLINWKISLSTLLRKTIKPHMEEVWSLLQSLDINSVCNLISSEQTGLGKHHVHI